MDSFDDVTCSNKTVLYSILCILECNVQPKCIGTGTCELFLIARLLWYVTLYIRKHVESGSYFSGIAIGLELNSGPFFPGPFPWQQTWWRLVCWVRKMGNSFQLWTGVFWEEWIKQKVLSQEWSMCVFVQTWRKQHQTTLAHVGTVCKESLFSELHDRRDVCRNYWQSDSQMVDLWRCSSALMDRD